MAAPLQIKPMDPLEGAAPSAPGRDDEGEIRPTDPPGADGAAPSKLIRNRRGGRGSPSARCAARFLRVLSLCAISFALTPAIRDAAQADVEHGVPPGQEELLKTMLGHGAALPGGCRFAGGTSAAIITAEYACQDGAVVLQLRDPDDAPPAALRTRHFALVVESGAVPPGLPDALAALIRAHEDDVQWDRVAGVPSALLGLMVGACAIAAVVLALQFLIVRGLAASPSRGSARPLTASDGSATGTAMDRTAGLPVLLTLALVAGYLVSRIAFLPRLPVFVDESIHIQWAQSPFGAYFIPEVSVGKWLPLQWMALFVRLPLDPLLGVRLASVSMGLATLLACVLINRELFSWAEGLLAGVVYALLPFALLYDRLALADVYVSAFGAWCVFFAIAMLRHPGPVCPLALSLCTLAAMLSKPTGGLFLAIPLLVGAVLAAPEQRRPYLARALPTVIGGAVFLAFLVAEGYGTHLLAAQSSLAGAGALGRFVANLRMAREWFSALLTPTIASATVAAMLLAFARVVGRARDEALLLALLALSFVPYALVSTAWFPRYVLFTVVPIALLLSRAIAVAAALLARPAARLSARAGGVAKGLLVAAITLWLALASTPRNLALMADPENAGLPPTERAQYVSGWASGYGLPELALFLREQAELSPINVVRFDRAGPPKDGLDVYLAASESVHKHTVDNRVDVAADQIANLARARRTLFILNPQADEAPSAAPSAYLGRAARIWSYTRPGDQTTLEVWEALRAENVISP